MLELPFFERVADALHSLIPEELGPFGCKANAGGIKVWFGDAAPPVREHYEAQFMRRRHVDGREGIVLEVGFHSEHPKREDNDAVIGTLVASEKRWRKALGRDAEAGVFLGQDRWRRLSEVWLESDLSGPDGELEVAGRLTDYITALEPVLRDRN
jgi:hypothetical protein